MTSGIISSHTAWATPCTICHTVEMPILKLVAMVWNELPVAMNLEAEKNAGKLVP